MADELEYYDLDNAAVESSNAKCKNCGSNVTFNPNSQNLKCPSCDSEFDFEKRQGQRKHDITKTKEDKKAHDQWAKEMRVVKCDTCGAKITVSGLDITTVCPYCGSDYVQEEQTLAGLKPDVVIPFAFDEGGAAELFQKNIKKKFFAPSKLKKKLPKNKIHGLYVPAFTFDADTSSKYDGVLEKVTTHTDSKGHTHRDVKRFKISGIKDMAHRDYVIESSSKMNSKQMNSLLPYNMDGSYIFTNDFVRGYSLEHYEDDMNVCYADAKSGMERNIKASILSKYDYTNVVSLNISTAWSNQLYSYRIVPIYIFEFDFNKKKYMTYMNGQTGKLGVGYPKSALKIGLTVALAVIVVALIIILIALGG